MHITFLLPVVGHPRHHKRIQSLRRVGVETRALAFERPDQLGPPRSEHVEVMGRINDREYGRRAAILLKAAILLRSQLRDTDVVYCFGADLLALAKVALLLSRRKPVLVLEVGDIVDALAHQDLRGSLARATEKMLLTRDLLLVSTSPTYVERYYEGILGLGNLKSFVLENKVDSDELPERPAPLPEQLAPPDSRPDAIRIGYFGLLRCPRSWEVLKALAKRGGDRVRIDVRGVAKAEMLERIKQVDQFPNIHFLGRYRVPEDLTSMYSSVNLCWMAHWEEKETWRWARSNRFYEACYFATPMIGQEGKDDTRLLERHDLGVSIDVTKPEEAVERVLSIQAPDVERWTGNLHRLPVSIFALTSEHEELKGLLGELCMRSSRS